MITKVIKIKKGLNIPIQGEAIKDVKKLDIQNYAIKPTDFIDIFPKLHLKQGEKVKAGTPLFYAKNQAEVQFSSPISGEIVEIRRGAKRKILEIKIKADGKNEYIEFPIKPMDSLNKDEIIATLLKSGAWVNIRQRPYNVIAQATDEPRDIYISTFDTAPLAPDFDYIFERDKDSFQAGVDVLAKLTKGKVHLGVKEKSFFATLKNAEIQAFSGPHPAGNVGIQIHHTKPINKGEKIWTISPQGVVIIGRLFLTGKYDVSEIIALTGSEVKEPQYFQLLKGASIEEMLKISKLTSDNVRYISGNIFTGTKIEANGYLGYYDQQLTIIPEGDYYEMFGWAMPRLQKFSYSKSYFSWLTPKKKFRFDTNQNGGDRPFVVTGEFERVLPMDIYPMQLLKAIIVKDLDMMENLGIYEVDEEDFALCEYVDSSKNEIQKIIREGLDYVRKEME